LHLYSTHTHNCAYVCMCTRRPSAGPEDHITMIAITYTYIHTHTHTHTQVYSLISTIRTVISAARDSQAKEALRRTGNAINSSTSPQTHRHTQMSREGRRPHTAPPPPPPPPPSHSLSSLGPLIMTLKEVIPIQKILDQVCMYVCVYVIDYISRERDHQQKRKREEMT
jgi:hypothetical protein